MNKLSAVVVDANTAIALAEKEAATVAQAKAALTYYTSNGYLMFAPGVIVSETLFALCGQQQRQVLSPSQYTQAVVDFHAFMQGVLPPPNEELSLTHTTRLLTFDLDLPKQVRRNAPSVSVHLLQ
jgi:hypothetical protein